VAVGMKDEVVDRSAFDEDVGVVGGQPVQVVHRLFAGEHVVDLALDFERAAIDLRFLRRVSDNAEIAGFALELGEVEGGDQFAGPASGPTGAAAGPWPPPQGLRTRRLLLSCTQVTWHVPSRARGITLLLCIHGANARLGWSERTFAKDGFDYV